MKKYIFKRVYVVIFVLLFSCESELDQTPISTVSADGFYKTEGDIKAGVIGVYSSLQKKGLYEEYLIAIGEEPSDNTFSEVPANDDGMFGELDEFSIRADNALIGKIWRDSYMAIQGANLILERIVSVNFTSSPEKEHYTGEMQFIRALLYFNLVRLYGDVPLVTEETTNPNDYFGQGRTSKTKVYSQIEKDLVSAIGLLSNGLTDGRATRTAAQALLGKVYLTLGKYSAAREQLLNVVNSGKHRLLSDITQIFSLDNEYNEEIIFAVKFEEGLNGNTEGSSAHVRFSPSTVVSGGKGHNIPTRELFNAYEAGDTRFTHYVDETPGGVPYSLKIKAAASVSEDGPSDTVVIRYADIILMLAECENELNNLTDAANYLNQIRNRAGLANTAATTQSELRNAIAAERRFELIGEGHRWFDLLRTGQAISVMNAWFTGEGLNIQIDENDLLMPIPLSQINTDPAITQNPGY